MQMTKTRNGNASATSMTRIRTLSRPRPTHPAMTPTVVPITNAVVTRENAMIKSILAEYTVRAKMSRPNWSVPK